MNIERIAHARKRHICEWCGERISDGSRAHGAVRQDW